LHKSTDWKSLTSKDLEREYNPSSVIGGDYRPYVQQYITQSQLSKKNSKLIECKYGPKPTNTLDLFIPKSASQTTPCPLMVFIHGGYWQELSKNESQFSALDFVNNDIAFAAIDYTLCPEVSIGEIINECRAAINWLQRHFKKYNYDPKNIYISGSSAGAHLAAMCSLKNWNNKDQSLAKLAGVILVSGIYDLEPLISTTINNSLGMDKNSAVEASPLFKELKDFPSAIITWGQNETTEFKEQSIIFSKALIDSGAKVQTLEIHNRNHFDIILGLGDDDEDLGKKVIKMIKDESR